MSLTLYYHPLSSFCWKVLAALYENEVPFTPRLVNLGDAEDRAAFTKLWPIGKFPVLRDDTRGQTVPESSIIIEYLAQHHPGRTALVPADAEHAREIRLRDRFFDLHVHMPMQQIVGDRLRPAGQKDPLGVQNARRALATALGMVENDAVSWTGDAFTMADCAAGPALYYANLVMPYDTTHPNVARYRERLLARPCFVRTLKEAEPYRAMFPKE